MLGFINCGRARVGTRTRRDKAIRRRFALEHLEGRALLNGTVIATLDTAHSALNVTGDQFNNSIAIVENADGTVTVSGRLGTSVDGNTSYTTPAGSPVTSINVKLLNGNDSVSLSGKPAVGQISTVSLQAGTGSDSFSVSGTRGNRLTIVAAGTAANADIVCVDSSTFGQTSITEGNGPRSSVSLTSSTLGLTTVQQGNGASDSISASNDTFGPLIFIQGGGQGDCATLANCTAFSATVSQGDGAYDSVQATALLMNPAGTGLSVTQGNGAYDQASADLQAGPCASIHQGDGYGDSAAMTGFCNGGVSIVQGNGATDQASEVLGQAVHASIVQGSGNGDYATVAAVGAVDIDVAQGVSSAASGDVTCVSDDVTLNSLVIAQGDGGNNYVSLEDIQTNLLSVNVGNGGGGVVEADNVAVWSFAGQILGGGAGNNFIDHQTNVGLTYPSTTWGYIIA